MDVELAEIADFLAEVPPFDHLGRAEIARIVPTLTQRYHRRGEVVLAPGDPNESLQIVRSGAVEICDPDGALLDTRDTGDCFGFSTLAASGPSRYLMQAAADTLVLVMRREVFDAVAERHPEVLEFFSTRTDRIRAELVATRVGAAGGDPLATSVADLLTRDPVTVRPEASIRAAAQEMATHRVSALLVTRGGADGDSCEVVGILSDRDLRTRVLAAGVDPDRPVAEVMTQDPVTVQVGARAFDAQVTMMERGVRHLPVMDGGRVVGVLSSTGLLRLAQADPVYLAAHVARAADRAALVEQAATLPRTVVELQRHGVAAADVARVVTAVADAATRRLLELAQERLGPAPGQYCWIALGSQARAEMGVTSDQDSALVLAAEPGPEGDRWWAETTAEVRDGLAEAGFAVCPGEMMASNPRWRMTVEQWVRQMSTWVQEPESENLLDAQVFFDLRAVAGDAELAEQVRGAVVGAAAASPRFQAHLARSAADWQPPLGFFRGLVVARRGEYRNTLDVKAGGLAPLVQIARLAALSAGLPGVSTVDRLRAAVAAGQMVQADAEDLVVALDVLRGLQLRHQCAQLAAGDPPDNHLDPTVLSSRDRHALREAFKVISAQQQALALKYPIRQM